MGGVCGMAGGKTPVPTPRTSMGSSPLEMPPFTMTREDSVSTSFSLTRPPTAGQEATRQDQMFFL